MFNHNSEETTIYQDIAEKYDQRFQLLEEVNQGYLREHGQINPEEHDNVKDLRMNMTKDILISVAKDI